MNDNIENIRVYSLTSEAGCIFLLDQAGFLRLLVWLATKEDTKTQFAIDSLSQPNHFPVLPSTPFLCQRAEKYHKR